MGIANPIGGIYHARRPDERVAPPQHRRRPGMRLLAGDRDLVPALTLGAGDGADRLLCRFEDRYLLDMRLQIGGERPSADRLGASKADPREFGAEIDPWPCQTLGEFENAGEHPEPTISGEKREPSSLVQAMISIGASVS